MLALTLDFCNADRRTCWRRNSTLRCLHSVIYSGMSRRYEEGGRELRKARSRCCVGSCEDSFACPCSLIAMLMSMDCA